MPIPNNPNVCKVTLVGHRDTREWVNTFHVHKIGGAPMTLADMLVLAPAYKQVWTSIYKSLLTPILGLDQVQVRKLDPSNPLALDYTTGLPDSGSRAGFMEAANVTLSISWRTGLAGRKHRGRFYVAGISQDDRTPLDQLNSTGVSFMASLADYMYNAPINAGPYEPVVFHAVDNTYTVINSYVIEGILDSQRRRLPGRGR